MSVSSPTTNGGSTIQCDTLTEISQRLLHNALATSSQLTYNKAVEHYRRFILERSPSRALFPASLNDILMFIAHCFSKNFAPATVTTYVSALGYFHRLRQMPDVSGHFLINKSLTGYRNLLKRPDIRLPITRNILWSLVQSLPRITLCHFTRTLFKAMFLVMFACFLRLGEVTATSSPPLIHRSHVSFKYKHPTGELIGFDLTIKDYKHSHGSQKQFFVPAQHDSNTCPVYSLRSYLNLRKTSSGPLFAFMNDSPIPRSYFDRHLRLALTYLGFDPSKYKGHSFRIGAATTAAETGFSETQIQQMGRWSSTAFRKYIRIPTLHC